MDGKRAKLKAGKIIGTRAAYGYSHVRDKNNLIETLEPNEQADIVKQIFTWYLKGDESSFNLSAAAIARKLSDLRIKTPGELNKGYHRKRESGMWAACTVLSIIQNEVYAGVWRYGVTIGDTRKKRPSDEWFEVSVPAIIERETWEAAQVKRKKNKSLARRNKKHDYLLSGMIKCGCGYSLSGEYFSNHCYYVCTWRNNHNTKLEKKVCTEKSVRADAIEADVWQSVIDIFTEPVRFEELLKAAQADEVESFDPKQSELDIVKAMISEAENEAVEVSEALKKASGIVGRTLENNMQDVNRRYDALIKRRDELQADLSALRLSDTAIGNALEFAEDVRLGIEFADYATKRAIFEMLDMKVLVKDGRFFVDCLLGQWDGEIRKMAKVGVKVGNVNDRRLPTIYNYHLSPRLPDVIGQLSNCLVYPVELIESEVNYVG
jgi:site-specific DNA recombinase